MKNELKGMDSKILSHLVIKAVKSLPNDYDLGKKIRQIYNLMEPGLNTKIKK